MLDGGAAIHRFVHHGSYENERPFVSTFLDDLGSIHLMVGIWIPGHESREVMRYQERRVDFKDLPARYERAELSAGPGTGSG